ncbi:MAG TPA: hypothetical protein VFD58_24180 [Blastocatellia bacterium]|nr:hypothetical protein [Blastocatellia bacterium]
MPRSRFDHHDVIAPIGAGGMGKVYHACIVSAPNHPNIVTIFENQGANHE